MGNVLHVFRVFKSKGMRCVEGESEKEKQFESARICWRINLEYVVNTFVLRFELGLDGSGRMQ